MHSGAINIFKKHFNFQAMVLDRRNRGSAVGAIAHQVLTGVESKSSPSNNGLGISDQTNLVFSGI